MTLKSKYVIVYTGCIPVKLSEIFNYFQFHYKIWHRYIKMHNIHFLKVLRPNGDTDWTYAFNGFGTNTLYQWTVGNYNSDSKEDVYVALAGDMSLPSVVSRVIDGSTHNVFWSKDETGAQGGYNRCFGPWMGYPASRDYDGDGKDEIFFDAVDHLEIMDWNGSDFNSQRWQCLCIGQLRNICFSIIG